MHTQTQCTPQISRITRDDDGEYHFTIDGTEYRTNERGEGLWVWAPTSMWSFPDMEQVYEWKQTLGTCQFSLATGDRRAKVFQIALQGEPDYDHFLYENGRRDTPSAAREFMRYYG